MDKLAWSPLSHHPSQPRINQRRVIHRPDLLIGDFGFRKTPALGNDLKGKLFILVYAAAIPLAFVGRWLALGLYVVVALI
ncbi:hypothetical protein [Polaromonas hydrogenivorans]|uniref:Uncharacterized protein n=1 Tax=Polaromonas hydrogenivorans TaxID=335476 RepID=A0AAU7LN78_9BURK